jgi:hypothetical protein
MAILQFPLYFSNGIAGGHTSQAGTHLYWVLGPSIFLVYFVRPCNRHILEASPVPLAFVFSTQVVDSILAPGGTKDLSIGWNTPYSSMLLNSSSTAVIHNGFSLRQFSGVVSVTATCYLKEKGFVSSIPLCIWFNIVTAHGSMSHIIHRSIHAVEVYSSGHRHES